MTTNYEWWQSGIVYQVYPRSYQDSNADGIGDLPGITERLDYVQSLGVDALWLSPIFPSPMHDFGYDVADYTGINPMFGTMEDFDRLLEETHARGLKLLLDLVPNHTSNEHEWFVESRSSRDNPKRDWYLWRDPAPDGGPPNNWRSHFGGSGWTLDELTGQYYMHQFVTQQPELNYRNPEVRQAMLDVMRFWLDKGVDGFRVDVIWMMMKDPEFRDEPVDPNWDGVVTFTELQHIYTQGLPEVHYLIRDMRTVMDEYDERVMIGEIYLPFEELVTYYGDNLDECHLPFNFHLILSQWSAPALRRLAEEYEAALPQGGWPNWVLGNHDQHRIATRIGTGQARVANMLLLTLRGTPTTYYGEELGMVDGEIPFDKIQDPPAVNQPEIAHIVGRDPERTPMQWSDAPHAGFTESDVEPWLPVADNYTHLNVAAQEQEPTSMLSFYRALTALRRAEPALSVGDYQTVEVGGEAASDIFAYRRDAEGEASFLVVLNLTDSAHILDLSQVADEATIAVATEMQRTGSVSLAALDVGANEGLLLRLPR